LSSSINFGKVQQQNKFKKLNDNTTFPKLLQDYNIYHRLQALEKFKAVLKYRKVQQQNKFKKLNDERHKMGYDWLRECD
jgi:hypothetical protein